MRNADKRRKLAILGVDIETCIIPRFKNLSNYSMIEVFAPKGFGLENKEISLIDGLSGGEIKIKSSEVFQESSFDHILDYSKCQRLYAGKYSHHHNIILGPHEKNSDFVNQNASIIFNFSLTPFCNKLLTQLSIRDIFRKKGIRVLHIGSRQYNGVLNYIDFPLKLFEATLYELEEWAEQMRRISQKSGANVLLLGIPGGLCCPDEFNSSELIQALYTLFKPTVTIANTPFCLQESEFDYLYNSIKTKYGIRVDIFNMSNIIVDWEKSDIHANQYDYYTVPADRIPDLFSKSKSQYCKYFSLYDIKQVEEMVDYIEKIIT